MSSFTNIRLKMPKTSEDLIFSTSSVPSFTLELIVSTSSVPLPMSLCLSVSISGGKIPIKFAGNPELNIFLAPLISISSMHIY
jgi:hypothetical protein